VDKGNYASLGTDGIAQNDTFHTCPETYRGHFPKMPKPYHPNL